MNADCHNTIWSYTCTCHAGYQGNGWTCTGIHVASFSQWLHATYCTHVDLNECNGGNRCDVNADCSNAPGSYTCRCHAGYQGDGFICRGILHSLHPQN